MKREVLEKRLAIKEQALEKYYEAYQNILTGGVKSYAIGSRNITKLDLPALEESIRKLEQEIDELTAVLSGRSRRKAVGIIPRNW